MPSPLTIGIKEAEVVKIILDFLTSRDLHVSMRSLERESGVVNGLYSDDVLFLRQLILDGQWQDVLEFIQPLENIPSFDTINFKFNIYKERYLELLCMRNEPGQDAVVFTVEEVVSCLNTLHPFCPNKDVYNSLCLLLTLPRLSDHPDYYHWNPSTARIKCFKQILPMVERFLPADRNLNIVDFMASNDRLVQLLIKGLLYESCVEFCQRRATGVEEELTGSSILAGEICDEADLSLLSWLQCLPAPIFSHPFEQKTLNILVSKMVKPPSMSWSEQILLTPTPAQLTPIKNKSFPSPMRHTGRPLIADMSGISKSVDPSYYASLQEMMQTPDELNQPHISPAALYSRGRVGASIAEFGRGGPEQRPTTAPEKQPPLTQFSGGNDISPPRKPNYPPAQPAAAVQPPQAVDPRTSTDVMYDEYEKHKLDLQKMMDEHKQRHEFYQQQLEHIEINKHNTPPQPQPPAPAPSLPQLQRGRVSPVGRAATNTPKQQYSTPTPAKGPTPQSSLATSTPRAAPPARSTPLPEVSPVSESSDVAKVARKLEPVFVKDGSGSSSVLQDPPPPPRSSNGTIADDEEPTPAFKSLHISDLDYTLPTIPEARNKDQDLPEFVPLTYIEDIQAIRSATFHPDGHLFAVGSNSKSLRVCGVPEKYTVNGKDVMKQATVHYKQKDHHKGSIYCIAWNPSGSIIASGSNDKCVKLLRYNCENHKPDGPETELTMHDGTVRDLTFMPHVGTQSPILVSGGAGDCNLYVTDCQKAVSLHALTGHSGHVLSVYAWGPNMLVSGAQDKTCRFWDLRQAKCINLIGSGSGVAANVFSAAVASVAVNSTGSLLATGQEDSTVMIYDLRAGKVLNIYQPHKSDTRSVRFSWDDNFLLSGSYDTNIVLTDTRGDVSGSLQCGVVAQHRDKIIQCRWHPCDYSFLSTSADRTVYLWTMKQ